jgi:hypothetical protein
LSRREIGAEFATFVSEQSVNMLRVAFLLTGQQAAAEDLLQTSLERLYVVGPTRHRHPAEQVPAPDSVHDARLILAPPTSPGTGTAGPIPSSLPERKPAA